jgi:hypothetical protein
MGDLLAHVIPDLNLIKKGMFVKFKTVSNMNLNNATDPYCYFPFSIFFLLQNSNLFFISFSKPWSVGW